MRNIICFLLIGFSLLLCSCSMYNIKINPIDTNEVSNLRTFRINPTIHDDLGRDIDAEILKDELERWITFHQLRDRAEWSLEEKGYTSVEDKEKPVDFVVDLCFSSFYSSSSTEAKMFEQKPASLLVGKKINENDMVHVIFLIIKVADPSIPGQLKAVWEGRCLCEDYLNLNDLDSVALSMMIEILQDFPNANRVQSAVI